MKIKLLPMAVGAILAAQFGVAHAAEVQVYGKVNVSAQSYDDYYLGVDKQNNNQLNSNASRVGVKGDLGISDDLKAVYKLEYELYVDDGSSGNASGVTSATDPIKARNNYGGFNSKTWGQIVAGKNDTPFKMIRNDDIDRFTDLDQGDMKNYLTGQDRVNNMILYTSPTFNNLTVNLMTYTNEQVGNTTSPACTGVGGPNKPTGCAPQQEDNTFKHWSTSVSYDASPFYAGISYNDDVTNTNEWRFVTSYKISDSVMIAGLAQTAKVHNTEWNEDGVKEYFGDGIQLQSGSLNTAMTGTGGAAGAFQTAIDKQTGYSANIKWSMVPDAWIAYFQYGHSRSTLFNSAAMSSTATGFACHGIAYSCDGGAGAEFDTKFYGIDIDRVLTKKVKVFAYVTKQTVSLPDDAYVQAHLGGTVSGTSVTNVKNDPSFITAALGWEIKF